MTCSGPLMSATHLSSAAQVLGLDRRQHPAQLPQAVGDDDQALAHLVQPDAEDHDEQCGLEVADENEEISAHSDSPAPV